MGIAHVLDSFGGYTRSMGVYQGVRLIVHVLSMIQSLKVKKKKNK